MQAGLDSSMTVPSGQSSGEMASSDGLIQESGGEPVSAGVHGEPAADEAIVVGPVTLALSRAGKRQHQVTARLQAGGEVVAVDTLDLARAGQRRNFIEQVLEKLALARGRGGGAGGRAGPAAAPARLGPGDPGGVRYGRGPRVRVLRRP